MKKLFALLACLFLALCAQTAKADPISLTDSTVKGAFFFLNHPNNNLFTPDKLDVGPGKEFVYDDGVATYSANFSAFKLTFRVNCDTGITLRKCDNEAPFGFAFKDKLFDGATFYLISNDLGVLPLVLGDPSDPKVMEFFDPYAVPTKNTTFVLGIIPAPEPTSLALLGTGMAAIVLMARRRFHA